MVKVKVKVKVNDKDKVRVRVRIGVESVRHEVGFGLEYEPGGWVSG